MFWDPLHIKVDVVHDSSQAVHAVIQVPAFSFKWLLTALYASPNGNPRNQLWQQLSAFNTSENVPWLIIGDFNEILCQEEKWGGRPFNPY